MVVGLDGGQIGLVPGSVRPAEGKSRGYGGGLSGCHGVGENRTVANTEADEHFAAVERPGQDERRQGAGQDGEGFREGNDLVRRLSTLESRLFV